MIKQAIETQTAPHLLNIQSVIVMIIDELFALSTLRILGFPRVKSNHRVNANSQKIRFDASATKCHNRVLHVTSNAIIGRFTYDKMPISGFS